MKQAQRKSLVCFIFLGACGTAQTPRAAAPEPAPTPVAVAPVPETPAHAAETPAAAPTAPATAASTPTEAPPVADPAPASTPGVVSPPGEARTAGGARRRSPATRTGDPHAVQAAVDAWARAHDGHPLRIVLRETDTARGAHVACPMGVVCDDHGPYRSFEFVDQGVWLRLSFDAPLAHEITLPRLQRYFDVASVIYNPEPLSFQGWDVRLGEDPVWRRNDPHARITGWRNGRVQGVLETELTQVRGRREHCGATDGPVPMECMVGGSARVPIVIEFDLPLPTGTLDCRGEQAPLVCTM